MSEEHIDEAKVSEEAIDAHYKALSDDDKKTFDELDDDAKATKKKEIGDNAIDEAKETALKKKGDTVPLATYLEQKKATKTLEEKVAKIEQDAKEKADKELEEKGEFKKLSEDRGDEIKTLTDAKALLETSLKVYTDATEKKVTDFISSVKEEDTEIVEAVLNGKTIVEKEALLPDLLKRFGSPDDINASAGGNADMKKKTALELDEAKKGLEEAKKTGNAMGVLKQQKLISELEAKGK